MIGILFIYWIWKGFTGLALEYDKSKWGYFGIGIASYYGGTLVSGFAVGLLSVLIGGVDNVADDSFINPGWNIFFVLCGGLACYGVYKLLENKGEKEKALFKKEGIDSIGVIDEN
ncbi:hypothetical protein [Flavobacterium quisquiliarum]|uniref:Uncharacterized protein n=1 Tax=Flavobacterium quisquiliarum TaxID=1834436 RepID=A0ABV8W9H8_9FLAO|nr:hypothetical protein [Flavobacterium quisquiliarum]MBW1658107.1 hypothetical protein [Flavobacterium quisquiliarum]NWK99878.1 hypothetical protein [Flavobacterium collinsii]